MCVFWIYEHDIFLVERYVFHMLCILLLSCHPKHLVSLHSCIYMDFLCPLDHPWSFFYVSRVKLSSFLYPLSIMTKRGRIYGEIVVSFYKILHVIGRNTCLRKGEMCFILLGGVLISFFLYLGSCDHVRIHWTYLLYMLMYVFFTYLYMYCFFSIFIHIFLLVCNLLFLFHTKMSWCVLFKVFQKYRLSKSTCNKLSSWKVF